MIKAEILLDSIGYAGSAPRLTSWLVTLNRFCLAEFNTHRLFSRNCPSSRAIPVAKRIEMIISAPCEIIEWGLDKPGMQAKELASQEIESEAIKIWTNAAMNAIAAAKQLEALGIHKQIVNRLLEPFVNVTVLMTSTQVGIENFFALRAEGAADPHIQKLAYLMLDEYNKSTPQVLQRGDWHIPFGDRMPEGLTPKERTKIAVARAARVSFNNFEGKDDIEKDFALHDRLAEQGHWSAFEHMARVPLQRTGTSDLDTAYLVLLAEKYSSGNLPGWDQLRKGYENECRKDPRVLAKG